MLNIFIFIASLIANIYSFEIIDFEGNKISLEQFEGKSILIVNISTGSDQIWQLGSLTQLQQQYGDSLVVIAFPTNSFNTELKPVREIAQFCKNEYAVNFIISEKVTVKGADISPLFRWLTSKAENGMIDGAVKGDFQKFLIDRQGKLIGVFSSEINPLNEDIVQAITTSN